MGVSYNLSQLIICLEIWLRAHEKTFKKQNLKTKNSWLLVLRKKRVLLSIYPQPQIGNL
jgi:hypothetical protein